MKIIEVCEFYSKQGGGVRTYVDEKFTAASTFGHDLTVVAPGQADAIETVAGGKLIWVKAPPIPGDSRYHLFCKRRAVDEIIRAENPDIIEGSSPWRGGWIAGQQCTTIPKALMIHQDPVATYPRTLLRHLLSPETIDTLFAWFFRYFSQLQSLYDVSMVSSPWLSDRLSNLGMERPKVVPFGMNKEAFRSAAPHPHLRQEMLQQCGVTAPDAKLLITLNRHHPEKRLPLLIEAVGSASKQKPVGLVILGDGPGRRGIERRARKTPGIHVAGYVNDRERIAAMLSSADAYIHGCPTEPYGMVIAEALSVGLPQIVPSTGGASCLPTPDCAEYFKPDSVTDCTRAILSLFERDQSALRKAAFQAASQIESRSDHFEKLFALYESLIAQRRAMA